MVPSSVARSDVEEDGKVLDDSTSRAMCLLICVNTHVYAQAKNVSRLVAIQMVAREMAAVSQKLRLCRDFIS